MCERANFTSENEEDEKNSIRDDKYVDVVTRQWATIKKRRKSPQSLGILARLSCTHHPSCLRARFQSPNSDTKVARWWSPSPNRPGNCFCVVFWKTTTRKNWANRPTMTFMNREGFLRATKSHFSYRISGRQNFPPEYGEKIYKLHRHSNFVVPVDINEYFRMKISWYFVESQIKLWSWEKKWVGFLCTLPAPRAQRRNEQIKVNMCARRTNEREREAAASLD